jgi:predicted nucleic acid-binding protein
MFDHVRQFGALVPGLWFLEVGNVLLQAERRGRIAPADVFVRLELISALPIAVDALSVAASWDEVLALARAHRLTTYDASYLELAMRRGLKLFTRDAALAGAARVVGVAVEPAGF